MLTASDPTAPTDRHLVALTGKQDGTSPDPRRVRHTVGKIVAAVCVLLDAFDAADIAFAVTSAWRERPGGTGYVEFYRHATHPHGLDKMGHAGMRRLPDSLNLNGARRKCATA